MMLYDAFPQTLRLSDTCVCIVKSNIQLSCTYYREMTRGNNFFIRTFHQYPYVKDGYPPFSIPLCTFNIHNKEATVVTPNKITESESVNSCHLLTNAELIHSRAGASSSGFASYVCKHAATHTRVCIRGK